jgi:predicted GNAT family acetyltransferase
MHQQAAYDAVIQALPGIMDATIWPDGDPTRVGTSIETCFPDIRMSIWLMRERTRLTSHATS